MSTVTVVKKGKKICISSETLTTFGTMKMNEDFKENSLKILKWGDSYVGIVGYVALNIMLQDVINTEKSQPDFSNRESIYKYFTKLHSKLKDKYFLNASEDRDDPVESSQFEIVIVNKHGMFGVHSLREVHQYRKFWAYGSGRRYALGAMNSVYDVKGFNAQKIAEAGVQAGITFDDASGGSIVSHTVKLEL